ncbi:MAG: DivIVA domain-containing protein [Fimbriimonadaceae bacterium]
MKEHVTPVELETVQLPISFRGYQKEAVDTLLRRVAADVTELLRENKAVAFERDRVLAELERHRSQEIALRDALVAAEQSAKAVRENAEREAELIREKAEVDARENRRSVAEAVRIQRWEAERLRAENLNAQAGLRAFLTEHLERLEAGASSASMVGPEAHGEGVPSAQAS